MNEYDYGKMKKNSTIQSVPGYFEDRNNSHPKNKTYPHFGRLTSTWKEFIDRIIHQQQGNNNIYKVIYFIRHAEGTHNEAERRYGTKKWNEIYSKDMKYFDANLTRYGIQQARNQSIVITDELQHGMPLSKIIVSPLARAIETALILFSNRNSSIKMITHEGCRETIGIHTCDKRHSKEYLEDHYNNKINFQFLPKGPDPLWTFTHRETDEELLIRANDFLMNIIAKEKDSFLAVVSHNGFISSCLQTISYPAYSLDNVQVLPVVIEIKPKSIAIASKSSSTIPLYLFLIIILSGGMISILLHHFIKEGYFSPFHYCFQRIYPNHRNDKNNTTIILNGKKDHKATTHAMELLN